MTIAGRREARFSDITKVRNLGTKFYAMSGKRQTVLVAQNTGGLADLVGETASLGADARDIATNSPTSNTLYILTDDGMQIATLANTPVLGAVVAFDPGDGRWILSTANAGTPYIVTPVDSGIQVLDQAGVRTSVSTPAGVAGCRDAVLGSDDVLYAVDEQRAKIHVWRITASKAVYIDSFRAKNCRDVIRMALDSTANILFVQCKHRIIGFNVTAAGTEDSAISVTLRQDYGGLKADYTDFAKIGTNKYWIGVDADSALNAAPQFYGRTYAAWDTTNQVLFAAFPDMSIFAASNVVPYVGEIQIPPTPGIPDVPVIVVPPVVPLIFPPAVTPPAPVITSSLTASVTEDSVFNYIITATGTGPITYSLVSPPGWLTSINSVTGAISGIPPDAGIANVTIRATNAGGSDTKILVVTVNSAIGDMSGVGVNGSVYEMVKVGALLYLVGGFSTVYDASGTKTRTNAACLDLATSLWTTWNPSPTGGTTFCVASDGVWIYLGGVFTTVNGAARSGLARVHPTTGANDTWAPAVNGVVLAIMYDGSSIWASGGFTTIDADAHEYVAKFTATTGALSSWRAKKALMPTFADRYLFPSSFGGATNVVDKGSSILILGGLSAVTETVISGVKSLGQGYMYIDKTTGDIAQSATYVPQYSKKATMVVGGSDYLAYSFGNSFINSTVTGLSIETLPASIQFALTISGTTANSAFRPDFSGFDTDPVEAYCLVGSNILIGGRFSRLGGDTTKRYLQLLTPTGVLVAGFTATFTGSVADIRSLVDLGGGAIAVGGGMDATMNGTTCKGIAIINGTTGVRY